MKLVIARVRALGRIGKGFRKDERGVVIVLFAILLPVVIGFLGLAIDVGFWYVADRALQTAADAGAVSGALELRSGSDSSSITAAALEEAERNGFDPDGGVISVNSPPTSGNHMDDNAVEVVLSTPATVFFSGILSSMGYGNEDEDGVFYIQARAVAKVSGDSEACILALDETAASAALVTGSADVTMSNCVMVSNSSHSSALEVSGSATLSTNCVQAVGGVSDSGGLTLTECTAPITNAGVTPDPYEDLEVPTSPAACTETNYKITGKPTQQVTMSPGRYCGGMDLQAGVITMESGVYILDGGDLKVTANATITGESVTIILTGSGDPSVTINGGGSITLTAPTSGDYAGVVMYLDRNDDSGALQTINGNSATSFTGLLYFPSHPLRFLGNNTSGGGCTYIVAKTVDFRGSADFSNDCDGVGVTAIEPPGSVLLVE